LFTAFPGVYGIYQGTEHEFIIACPKIPEKKDDGSCRYSSTKDRVERSDTCWHFYILQFLHKNILINDRFDILKETLVGICDKDICRIDITVEENDIKTLKLHEISRNTAYLYKMISRIIIRENKNDSAKRKEDEHYPDSPHFHILQNLNK
jgi:hypothetical protein